MSQYLIAHIGHTTKWVEHVTWWKPESRGYSFCIEKAGLYDEVEARAVCQYGGCIAVSMDAAQAIAMSTPYYRRQDGQLARLYDGGDLVVVPNSKDAWMHLMANRLLLGATEKPTPIPPSKARAAYLPEPSKEVAHEH